MSLRDVEISAIWMRGEPPADVITIFCSCGRKGQGLNQALLPRYACDNDDARHARQTRRTGFYSGHTHCQESRLASAIELRRRCWARQCDACTTSTTSEPTECRRDEPINRVRSQLQIGTAGVTDIKRNECEVCPALCESHRDGCHGVQGRTWPVSGENGTLPSGTYARLSFRLRNSSLFTRCLP